MSISLPTLAFFATGILLDPKVWLSLAFNTTCRNVSLLRLARATTGRRDAESAVLRALGLARCGPANRQPGITGCTIGPP